MNTLLLVVASAMLACAFAMPSDLGRIPQSCDTMRFTECNKALYGNFGIAYPVSSVDDYKMKVWAYLFRMGVGGWINHCDFHRAYFSCLGNMADDCFTAKNLMGMGMDIMNAYGTVAYYGQMKYECQREGFNAVVENWACTTSVLQSPEYINTIRMCSKAFAKGIQPFPGKMGACKLGQTMITCMSTPVQMACGSQLGMANCGALRAGMNQAWPGMCEFTC